MLYKAYILQNIIRIIEFKMNGDKKIIITVTTSNSLIYPEVKNWAQTDEKLIEDVVKCYIAGAAVVNIHLPRGKEVETVKQIRERCDIIIQVGMSSESIPERKRDFNANPDMISVMLDHHSKHYLQTRIVLIQFKKLEILK